jgi:bacterial/archaeal transporter family protein
MQQWLVFALLSAVFAALTAIFAKAGLKEVNADLATAIRTAIILLITWGVVFYKGIAAQAGGLSRNNWIFLTLSAFATGASWLFYYRALQLGKASEVSIVDKGSLVFTLLLSFIFLREPITARVLVAGGLIFAGMLVLIWK